MSKALTGIEKINNVCKAILKITNQDIAEAREVARKQLEYNNPLRMATVGWQRDLSEHNTKVLDELVQFRNVILGGAEINKP